MQDKNLVLMKPVDIKFQGVGGTIPPQTPIFRKAEIETDRSRVSN